MSIKEQLEQIVPQFIDSPSHSSEAFDIVTIAASAGCVQAIRQLVAGLPSDFPAAIVVQTHQAPQHPSMLAEVLGWRSALPAVWGAHYSQLRRGCVTVAPPGHHMRVGPGGLVSLISWEQMGYIKPHANGLFTSVATSFTTRAIGVVLTGYLSDGAQGVRAIGQHGGKVLVQDPATAEAPDMPRAAINTGYADFVLPLSALAAALVALVMVRGAAQFFAVPHSHVEQPYRAALRTWQA